MTTLHSEKIAFTILLVGILMLAPIDLKSQENFDEKVTDGFEDIAEGPLMYKFEPDFVGAEEQRKAEIKFARTIIDTLTISERKRRRLLKDLYKNGISERLTNTWLVDTKFEDQGKDEN